MGTGCHWSFALWVPCEDGCGCAVWPLSRVWETVPSRRPDCAAGSEAALLSKPCPLRGGLGALRVGPSETPATFLQEGAAELQEESCHGSEAGPGPPFHGETSAHSWESPQIRRLPRTDHVATEPATAPVIFRRSLNNGLSKFFFA